MIFDAIVLAGKSEKDVLLLEQEKVPAKAFLKLNDKLFLQHQIEVLGTLDFVRDIYVSGMKEEDWKEELAYPVIFEEFESDIISKLKHFRYDVYTEETLPDYVLILSSDVPLINKDAILRFIEKCKQETEGELKALYYMCLVDQKVMESKFPESDRTYVKLKDVNWCTGDIMVVKPSIIETLADTLDQLVNNRKQVFKAILVLSPMTVIKIIFRRITMAGFNDAINKYLFKQPNSCFGILADDPEIGMDVDKPFQLDIVREYYAEHVKK